MNTKICRRCGKEKKLEEFPNNSKTKDGKSSWCKSCTKKYQDKYRQKKENKLKKSELNKKYYQENKDYWVKWREENPNYYTNKEKI